MDTKHNYEDSQQKKDHSGNEFGLDATQQSSHQYFCSRCNQTISLSEKDEHEDWHFAKDLQAQEDDARAPERPAAAAPQPRMQNPKHADNSQSNTPASYAPPSYPPPQNAASRATAIYRHTNQVIEAAQVRARDEVPRAFALK